MVSESTGGSGDECLGRSGGSASGGFFCCEGCEVLRCRGEILYSISESQTVEPEKRHTHILNPLLLLLLDIRHRIIHIPHLSQKPSIPQSSQLSRFIPFHVITDPLRPRPSRFRVFFLVRRFGCEGGFVGHGIQVPAGIMMGLFRFLTCPSLMVLMSLIRVVWISATMMMMTTTTRGRRRGRASPHFSRLWVKKHIPLLPRSGSEDGNITLEGRIVPTRWDARCSG